jgi:hypothetical protein
MKSCQVFRRPEEKTLPFVRIKQKLFKCLSQTHVTSTHWRRDELCDSIDLGVRDLQSPAYVLDGGLRSHGPEGDDLAHGVATIETGDVVDNVASASNTVKSCFRRFTNRR